MKFKSLQPILWTENLDETIGFYLHILGFSLNERNEDWQWASLQKDGIQIMISKPNQHEQLNRICFSGSFYFNVENVDEVWEDLKIKANICYEIETFEWGMREFAIYDNNGYILQFAQPASEISREE
ncbi:MULTISPECIES: VOC family protein [Chryseobacterium]|uniref:VOC family protein n=1 Tax=Chryseobacterium TaxID=59732 RepID=UPI00293D29AA|nr:MULTISPECIES: VOC family protein [Chryseobacterium]MBM7419518.1 putative glyoxalase superfamily protein PhnB [Chryseobacterium sp. JUb44]WSO12281.1 VOC family protein [Chryseobacterium scophthalmum]